MTIRLRDKAGRLLPVEPAFVELAHSDGSVARVLYRLDNGAISDITADDIVEADRYARVMGVKFIPVNHIDIGDLAGTAVTDITVTDITA